MLPLVVESGFLLHETLEKLGIVRLEGEQNPGYHVRSDLTFVLRHQLHGGIEG